MSQEKYIDALADQIAGVILSREDMRLAEDWREAIVLNIEPREMRHARKRLVQRGWMVDTRSGGFRYVPPAAHTEQVPALQSSALDETGINIDANARDNQRAILEGLLEVAKLLQIIADREVLILQATALNTTRIDKLIELWR